MTAPGPTHRIPLPSIASASGAQAQKSLEHSVEQKSHSFANLAPETRYILHRLSCASVPPDFIDQKEKGISDQSEGEIDENSVFHCFPQYVAVTHSNLIAYTLNLAGLRSCPFHFAGAAALPALAMLAAMRRARAASAGSRAAC